MTQKPVDLFDEAYEIYLHADREIDGIVNEFCSLRDGLASKEDEASFSLYNKAERAIDELTNNRRYFYFSHMNATELWVPTGIMNEKQGMNGLDWPEALRHGLITKTQREISRRFNALAVMRQQFPALSDDERAARANCFP